MNETSVSPWVWAAFLGLVAAMLAVDLFAHSRHGTDSRRRALAWSAGWIGMAALFGVGVLLVLGAEAERSSSPPT